MPHSRRHHHGTAAIREMRRYCGGPVTGTSIRVIGSSTAVGRRRQTVKLDGPEEPASDRDHSVRLMASQGLDITRRSGTRVDSYNKHETTLNSYRLASTAPVHETTRSQTESVVACCLVVGKLIREFEAVERMSIGRQFQRSASKLALRR